MKQVEVHHFLYESGPWEGNTYTSQLRQLPSMRGPMQALIEQALHTQVPAIPVIDSITAQHVLREFHPSRTYISSVYGLMTSIETALRHPKAKPIQKQLGELTVYGLELQIPFLREGLISNEVGHGGNRLARR